MTLSTTKREGHGAEKSVLPEGYDLGNLLAFVGEYLPLFLCRGIVFVVNMNVVVGIQNTRSHKSLLSKDIICYHIVIIF